MPGYKHKAKTMTRSEQAAIRPPSAPPGSAPGAAWPPTQERRRCACMARAGGASRRTRSAPRRQGTPDNCARPPSMTGPTGHLRAWAGSRPHDHTRARGRHARRATLLSIKEYPRGPGPRVLPTPLGRFYFPHPAFQAGRNLGAKRAPARRERKGGPQKASAESSEAKPGGRLDVLGEFLGALARTTDSATLAALCALLVAQSQQRGFAASTTLRGLGRCSLRGSGRTGLPGRPVTRFAEPRPVNPVADVSRAQAARREAHSTSHHQARGWRQSYTRSRRSPGRARTGLRPPAPLPDRGGCDRGCGTSGGEGC